MNCKLFTQKLSYHHDGELPEKEIQEINIHMAGCDKCREDKIKWEEMVDSIKSILKPYDASISFAERVSSSLVKKSLVKPKPRILYIGAAACIILAAILLVIPRSSEIRTRSGDVVIENNTILTHIGKSGSVSLPDNTLVELNENTELKLVANRNLELVKGEATIDVVKQPEQFMVSSKPANVLVLGTKFKLTLINNCLTVQVMSGQVRVENKYCYKTLSYGEIATCQEGEKDIKQTDPFAELKSLANNLTNSDPQVRDKNYEEILKLFKKEKNKAKEMTQQIKKLAAESKDFDFKQKLNSLLEHLKTGCWQIMSECPVEARDYHTSVIYENQIIVWAGYARKTYPKEGAKYNTKNNTWSIISESPIQSRYQHSCLPYKDKMIIAGGISPKWDSFDVAIYDITKDSWKKIDNCPFEKRVGYTSALYEDKLVLYGGRYPDGKHFNDGAIYDITNDSWIKIEDCPTDGRAFHKMVIAGDKLFLWAGRNPELRYHKDGALYDITKKTWKKITDCPIQGKLGCTLLAYKDKVIIWGGWDGKHFNTGAIYDLTTDKWTSIKECPLKARHPNTSFETNGKIIIWGGKTSESGDKYLNDGAIYNIETNTWTQMSKCPIDGRIDAEFIHNNDMFVVWGGRKREKVLSDGAIYQITTNKWIKMKESILAGRESFTMNLSDDKVIIWGGGDSKGNPLKDGAIYELPISPDLD